MKKTILISIILFIFITNLKSQRCGAELAIKIKDDKGVELIPDKNIDFKASCCSKNEAVYHEFSYGMRDNNDRSNINETDSFIKVRTHCGYELIALKFTRNNEEMIILFHKVEGDVPFRIETLFNPGIFTYDFDYFRFIWQDDKKVIKRLKSINSPAGEEYGFKLTYWLHNTKNFWLSFLPLEFMDEKMIKMLGWE